MRSFVWAKFCYSYIVHFSKRLKFVLGLPKCTKIGIFYQENAFHAGKKIGKNDFAPLKNMQNFVFRNIFEINTIFEFSELFYGFLFFNLVLNANKKKWNVSISMIKKKCARPTGNNTLFSLIVLHLQQSAADSPFCLKILWESVV